MKRIVLVCSIVLVMFACSEVARAEGSAAAGAPAPILPQGLVGVLGGVNNSPFLIAAAIPVNHPALWRTRFEKVGSFLSNTKRMSLRTHCR